VTDVGLALVQIETYMFYGLCNVSYLSLQYLSIKKCLWWNWHQ